jgi:hypothetical protein
LIRSDGVSDGGKGRVEGPGARRENREFLDSLGFGVILLYRIMEELGSPLF